MGLNRAAAYTLYQPRAQITLRLKTEHVNAQESWWHRNEEWATIFLAPLSVSLSHAHTFHLFLLSNFLFDPPSTPSFSSPPVLLVFAQQFFMAVLIVPLILLCVFIAPFVKLEAPADKPITIQ